MHKPFSKDFEQLMADPRLAELNELQRGASDALDLVELSENQNSDILAWLFESREAHGQSDEILRDLLLYASMRAMDSNTLEEGSVTRQFFNRWVPSRIRTTSFGGAFPVREFGFNRGNRTDLAVIDEQNQLVVVIENKTKTKHSDDQLTRYRKDFEKAIQKNKRLSKYLVAFIAMSEVFDSDEEADQPSSKTWLHVGYGWLKASAYRAVRQVERGNASAQLVASYCTLRTQWIDPLDRKRVVAAAGLLRDYPRAISELRKYIEPKMTARWFQEGTTSAAMLFVLQNRSTAHLLAKLNYFEGLAAQIETILGFEPDDGVEWRKSSVSVRAPHVEHLSVDDYWVSYFIIEHSKTPVSAEQGLEYDIKFVLRPDKISNPIEADIIRKRYSGIDKKFSENSSRKCTAVLGKGLSEVEALRVLQQHYRSLSVG